MNNKAKINLFTWSIVFISAILGVYLFVANVGAATSQTSTTVSNATVAVSLGFTFSNNLSAGVLFGSLNQNTNNNNATGNHNATLLTMYNITMSSDNNANADTCLSDNQSLLSGSNQILNGNYTFDANSTINGNNLNVSGIGGSTISTTSTLVGTTALAANQVQHFKFYLDVPSGQPAGVYNNQLSFKVLETGVSC